MNCSCIKGMWQYIRAKFSKNGTQLNSFTVPLLFCCIIYKFSPYNYITTFLLSPVSIIHWKIPHKESEVNARLTCWWGGWNRSYRLSSCSWGDRVLGMHPLTPCSPALRCCTTPPHTRGPNHRECDWNDENKFLKWTFGERKFRYTVGRCSCIKLHTL